MRAGLLLVALLALPGPTEAQAGSSGSSLARVDAEAAIRLKASRIAGKGRFLLGGEAGLLFARNLSVGGGGYALLNEVELAGSQGGTGFNLTLGYGGISVRHRNRLTELLTGEAGLLLGGGHAEVRNQLTRTEVGSDNFFVAEAEYSVLYSPLSGTQVGLSLGYRLTGGVEDLPTVSADDLNGFTATVSLGVGGR